MIVPQVASDVSMASLTIEIFRCLRRAAEVALIGADLAILSSSAPVYLRLTALVELPGSVTQTPLISIGFRGYLPENLETSVSWPPCQAS